MKVCISMFIGLLILSGLFVSASRADGFKEGKWSMTMVTRMENMPPEMAAAMKQMDNMPPEAKAAMQQMQAKMGVTMSSNGQGMTITTSQCMTKAHPIPQHMKAQDNCQETHEMNGNTFNFHVTCNNHDVQVESTGSMTYSGDTMQGHIKSHEMRSGQAMDTSIDINGQYVGPCSS